MEDLCARAPVLLHEMYRRRGYSANQGWRCVGKAPARLLTLGLDARENSIGFAARLKRPAPHNYILIFSSTAADEMLTSIIDPGHHF
jgi:hypothetical protein